VSSKARPVQARLLGRARSFLWTEATADKRAHQTTSAHERDPPHSAACKTVRRWSMRCGPGIAEGPHLKSAFWVGQPEARASPGMKSEVLRITPHGSLFDRAYAGMNEPGEALSRRGALREALQAEVTGLENKRQEFEALGEALAGVDAEPEAKRRMLGLVQATVQDLGQQQGAVLEGGGDHSPREAGKGVRGGRYISSPHSGVIEVCPVLQEPTPAIPLKRPASPDVKPQPLPARPVPMVVWEDHLLPLLTGKDAGRLICTCEALGAMLREIFQGDLGDQVGASQGGTDDLSSGAQAGTRHPLLPV
jgi:hypothetical protein